MIPKLRRPSTLVLWIATALCTSCSRAPSFDILGSFFPAWLLCLIAGLLLTAASSWLFSRTRLVLAVPVLAYPSLAALFTFALWLALFQ